MLAGGLMRTLAVLLVLLGASSCNPFKRSRPKFQLPPLPPPEAVIPSEPFEFPEPPVAEQASVSSLPALPFDLVEAPIAPEPEPAKRPRRPQAAKTAGQSQPQEPAAPEPAQPTPPRLTQLLTASQAEEYRRSIDEMLARAETNLGKLAGVRLGSEQLANLQRARGFIQQAQQAREADLVTAHSLAQRADILAQDLVRNLTPR